MNIKLTISYDGIKYHGFQKQPNVITIEEELNKAIEKTVKHKVKIYGAGRTDSGVHALGQVANFYSDTNITMENLPRVINYHLPEDISVIKAEVVPDDFHARFSAKGKHYRYIVFNGKHRNALYSCRAMHYNYPIEIERMEEAFEYLIGEHDYKTFMGRYAVVKDTIRRIDKITVKRKGQLIIVDFYGKSFLKNMIRIIMGTALEIGRGRLEPISMKESLESKKRISAGPTAPSYGLYLMDIYY